MEEGTSAGKLQYCFVAFPVFRFNGKLKIVTFNRLLQILIIRWQFGPFQLIFEKRTWNQFGYPIFSNPRIKRQLIKIYSMYILFLLYSIFRSLRRSTNYYYVDIIENGTPNRTIHEVILEHLSE